MKKLLILLLVCTAKLITYAQTASPRVVLAASSVTIKPIYTAKGGTARDTFYRVDVKVHLNGTYDSVTAANNVVSFAFAPNFSLSGNPVIVNPVQTVTITQWVRNTDLTLSLLIKGSSLPAKLQADEIAHIIIQGQPDSFVTVRLSAKEEEDTKYDGQKPYWVETGTNIDFIDGPKANNLTGGIFYQKFDNSWGHKKLADTRDTSAFKWAFFAGAYESKIISDVRTTHDTVLGLINNTSYKSGKKDTIAVYNYAGRQKQIQTVRNWSFFLSPSWKLTKGKYNDGSFHAFASFWAELRYQEIELKTDNSTLVLLDTSYDKIDNKTSYTSSADTVTSSSLYSHYYGFGVPFYYEDKSVTLFMNPVFGLSNQPSSGKLMEISKLGGTQRNSEWKPFYFVQFRLSDNLFGITVTGEIRGLIIRNSPPQYTIALTKKFNLEKLLTFNNNK